MKRLSFVGFCQNLVILFFVPMGLLRLQAEEEVIEASQSTPETQISSPAPKVKKKPRSSQRKKKARAGSTAMLTSVPKKQASTIQSTKESLQEWLVKLKKRVARNQARQNQLVAVAAVRGDESPEAPPLYWKGKKISSIPKEPTEIEDFENALGLALDGNSTLAKSKLEEFISAYPKSSLIADAQQTLKLLEPASSNQ